MKCNQGEGSWDKFNLFMVEAGETVMYLHKFSFAVFYELFKVSEKSYLKVGRYPYGSGVFVRVFWY